jgi:hypothetical protein
VQSGRVGGERPASQTTILRDGGGARRDRNTGKEKRNSDYMQDVETEAEMDTDDTEYAAASAAALQILQVLRKDLAEEGEPANSHHVESSSSASTNVNTSQQVINPEPPVVDAALLTTLENRAEFTTIPDRKSKQPYFLLSFLLPKSDKF